MTELKIKIRERILTEAVILKEKPVTLSERILTPTIRAVEKTVKLSERILSDPVHIFGHSFEALCPTPFVFSSVLPSLVVVGADTTLRGAWNTDYDKNNARIAFKKDAFGQVWQYTAWLPIIPAGTYFYSPMITPLDSRTNIGYYDWYVQNRDSCANQESSSQHRFSIGWNAILREFSITIIS